MISSKHLTAYLLTASVIMLAPGPSVLFAIARAVSYGRVVALLTVVGNALGMFVQSTAVAFGFGPILQSSPLVFSIVQWVGGAYLIWLGIDAIRSRRLHATDIAELRTDRPKSFTVIRQGFFVGILNPKAVVFFAAVLPQFVDRDFGSVTAQLFTLGALFCLIAVFSDGAYALLAGTLRLWLAGNPTRLERLRAVGGFVMIGLGAVILATTPLPR